MTLGPRSQSSTPVLVAVAMLVSASLGAGVTAAALHSPAKKPAPVPVIAQPAAVSAAARPAAPAPRPRPVNQTFKATLVSATTDSVTVQGVGSLDGTPDVTILSLQVSVTRPSSGEAMSAANAVVSKVLASLRHHGVAEADIQSTGLTLYATYDYHENGPPTRSGYQSGQSISAKLRTAKTRGATISAAAGVSPDDVSISGLSYDLEHDAALLTGAQKQAFDAARKKARQYADLAGRSLGRVMTIREVTTPDDSVPYPQAGGLPAAAPASDVPLASGSQSVSVSVTVTWALR
jgi:uncharacterized protein YggE